MGQENNNNSSEQASEIVKNPKSPEKIWDEAKSGAQNLILNEYFNRKTKISLDTDIHALVLEIRSDPGLQLERRLTEYLRDEWKDYGMNIPSKYESEIPNIVENLIAELGRLFEKEKELLVRQSKKGNGQEAAEELLDLFAFQFPKQKSH